MLHSGCVKLHQKFLDFVGLPMGLLREKSPKTRINTGLFGPRIGLIFPSMRSLGLPGYPARRKFSCTEECCMQKDHGDIWNLFPPIHGGEWPRLQSRCGRGAVCSSSAGSASTTSGSGIRSTFGTGTELLNSCV